MKYKQNWDETKEKWIRYWKQENVGRPLMCVVTRKPEIESIATNGEPADVCRSEGKYHGLPGHLRCYSLEDKYLNAKKMVDRYRYFCETHEFMGESFPNMNVDFGPGSLAGYLGSKIVFNENAIWFEPCVKEWDSFSKIQFQESDIWFQKHIELSKECKKFAGNDFYICIPDLMENLDVLASLRGSMDLSYDFIDCPEELKRRVQEVNEVYFEAYDRFYEIVKNEDDNGSAYMVFQIWGEGRTAKLQCDFGAMISSDDFRNFVLDSLKKQAEKLDNVVYHLDGPDNIKHLDAILEVDGIDAIQWTSGDSGPDGTLEKWNPIYDKAIDAGKSIWVKVYSGQFEDWVKNADRLVKRYGSHSLFLHFPEMSQKQGWYLLEYAEKNWQDIEGTYKIEKEGVKV